MTTGPARLRDGKPTRDAIVAAATRLMQIKGYNATSLDDVLTASDVGKGSFYHYFRSKEELGHAILDRVIGSFTPPTVDPCFSYPGIKPLTPIRRFFDRLVEAQRERNCVAGCPLGNLASQPP